MSETYITFPNPSDNFLPELRHFASTLFILSLQSHTVEQIEAWTRLNDDNLSHSWQKCAKEAPKDLHNDSSDTRYFMDTDKLVLCCDCEEVVGADVPMTGSTSICCASTTVGMSDKRKNRNPLKETLENSYDCMPTKVGGC